MWITLSRWWQLPINNLSYGFKYLFCRNPHKAHLFPTPLDQSLLHYFMWLESLTAVLFDSYCWPDELYYFIFWQARLALVGVGSLVTIPLAVTVLRSFGFLVFNIAGATELLQSKYRKDL